MIKIEKIYMPKDTAAMLRQFNLEKGGLVQQAIDNAVISYCLPYTPWETGTLGKSPYAHSKIGSGRIIYPGPYARYLYYGEVYGPNFPIFEDGSEEPTAWFSKPGEKKQPTGRDLEYARDVNPLAGSFWFERMKADHLQDIIEEAKNVAGSK
jgi:hypothetical protein